MHPLVVSLPPTHLYQRKINVRSGSIEVLLFSQRDTSPISRAWIPHFIAVLECECFRKYPLSFISFESHSRLTCIEAHAFSHSSLQSIRIPQTVEILGPSCFRRCKSLSDILFESNSHLTRIEREAFLESSLQSIVIPSTVEVIGPSCFSWCQSLSFVSFEPNSRLACIESETFAFSAIAAIVIPSHVEILAFSSFANCKSFSSISFESNSRLTRIESYAFSSLNFQMITIPRLVQFIDGAAFLNIPVLCVLIEPGNETFVVENDFLIDRSNRSLIRTFSAAQDVTIPTTIEILGLSCFSGCQSLSSISFELDSRLARIDRFAFSDSALKSIVIPCNVEILGQSCFSNCKSLSSLSFESNSRLTRIESNAFSESSLQTIVIPRSVTVLCSSCFYKCDSLSSVSFEANSGLLGIEGDSFAFSSIRSIIIPGKAQAIDGSAFIDVKLTSLSIEPGNETFILDNGLLIHTVHHMLIRNFSDSSSITIPNHVAILGWSSFAWCQSVSSILFESDSCLIQIEPCAFLNSSLQSISIPQSVQILCSSCFSNCHSLSSISFQPNSELLEIDSHAFAFSSLQSLVIPRNVYFIHGSAFAHLNLLLIEIEPGNETFILENDLLIDIVHHVLIRSFSNSSNIAIPSDIEILGQSSFSNCKLLSSISFESDSHLRQFGASTFSYSSLKSIVVPRTVEVLGVSCFSFSQSLSSLSFDSPSQLKRIESRAFDGLRFRIRIPSTVLFVASDAIPDFVNLVLAQGESCPEFDQWRRLRMTGITGNFELIPQAV
jgi:uncharacterized Fe-S cluster-containing radical SAM superfamily protein